MFARELSEKLKGLTSKDSNKTFFEGTNVTVTVTDPGRTKSALSAQMDGQTFFLSRWLLRIVRLVKLINFILYFNYVVKLFLLKFWNGRTTDRKSC